MPLDPSNAQSVIPSDAPVSEASPFPPSSINLEGALKVKPQEAPVLGGLTRAGVTLVKWVLVMISVFTASALVWIIYSEVVFGLRASEFSEFAAPDLQTSLAVERSDFREFWLKIFQMVLLNVLLPVLTALLGYIFGSSKDSSRT
jgi:hypothetical protein